MKTPSPPPRPLPLLAALLAAVALLASFAATAKAHRVNVFAWCSGSTVQVTGSFSRKNPARNAEVTVYDRQRTNVLAKGTTSSLGEWSFPQPEAARTEGLLIELNAGEGHLSTFTLRPQDCQGAAGSAPKAAPLPAAAAESPPERRPSASPETAKALRAILREELSLALAPLTARLMAESVHEPSLTDVLGGLGWIVALVSLALLRKAQRRPPTP